MLSAALERAPERHLQATIVYGESCSHLSASLGAPLSKIELPSINFSNAAQELLELKFPLLSAEEP